jgi:hypothetical protein
MWPINRLGHDSADVEATPASREAHVRRPAMGTLPDQLEPAAIPADPRRARRPWSGQMCPIDLEDTFRRRIEATGAAREADGAGARRDICAINLNGQQSPQTHPRARSPWSGEMCPINARGNDSAGASKVTPARPAKASARSTCTGRIPPKARPQAPAGNLPVQLERAGIRGGGARARGRAALDRPLSWPGDGGRVPKRSGQNAATVWPSRRGQRWCWGLPPVRTTSAGRGSR